MGQILSHSTAVNKDRASIRGNLMQAVLESVWLPVHIYTEQEH